MPHRRSAPIDISPKSGDEGHNAPTHLIPAYAPQGIRTLKALASEPRLAILELLASGPHNINEIALALGLAQPAASKHVQILERAGLLSAETLPGAQGLQKRCRLVHERLLVALEGDAPDVGVVEEQAMPVGLFTRVEVRGTCGMAGPEGLIGWLDEPRSFFCPERTHAGILWTAGGFVEYAFPVMAVRPSEIERVELLMEICSESPGFDADWPSDITLWMNGIEVGTWTSPGDFGGRRGRLNPDWWMDNMTQSGVLKVWIVDGEGASVDGTEISGVTVRDLGLDSGDPLLVRIGVKDDAEHAGGFNLFGRTFGNYAQDLVLRLHSTSSASRPEKSAEPERAIGLSRRNGVVREKG